MSTGGLDGVLILKKSEKADLKEIEQQIMEEVSEKGDTDKLKVDQALTRLGNVCFQILQRQTGEKDKKMPLSLQSIKEINN